MTDDHKKNEQDNEEQNVQNQTDEIDYKVEYEKLKEKSDEYLNGWKRAKADYSNLKKEFDQKGSEIVEYANSALLAELIPIYDNFKLAYNSHDGKEVPNEFKPWFDGVGFIKKQMEDFLNKFGLEEIKTIGEKFDPLLHESVGKEKVDGKDSGIILKEIKPGYTLKGKLLIAARVVVAE